MGGASGADRGELRRGTLQHVDAICGGFAALSVTDLDIHDNVIALRFPTLDFLQ